MIIWRLTLPAVVPEDSLPFLGDRRLTTPDRWSFYIKSEARVPNAYGWQAAIRRCKLDQGTTWLVNRVMNYYPTPEDLEDTFSEPDTVSRMFNISEFHGAPVYASLNKMEVMDLDQIYLDAEV